MAVKKNGRNKRGRKKKAAASSYKLSDYMDSQVQSRLDVKWTKHLTTDPGSNPTCCYAGRAFFFTNLCLKGLGGYN